MDVLAHEHIYMKASLGPPPAAAAVPEYGRDVSPGSACITRNKTNVITSFHFALFGLHFIFYFQRCCYFYFF